VCYLVVPGRNVDETKSSNPVFFLNVKFLFSLWQAQEKDLLFNYYFLFGLGSLLIPEK